MPHDNSSHGSDFESMRKDSCSPALSWTSTSSKGNFVSQQYIVYLNKFV